MILTKQIALIIPLLFLVSFTYANDDNTSSAKILAINALVASQPEKALTSIEKLKQSNIKLTTRQNVKLIRHEIRSNLYLNRHQQALKLVSQLKEISAKEKDKVFLWHYYDQLAIIYWHMDDVEESLNLNLKAYEVVKSLDKLRKFRSASEGNVGYALIQLGFYKQAKPYIESSIEFSIAYESYSNLATGYNNLGEAYLGLKNYSMALKFLNKSLKLRNEHQLIFHTSYSYQNLGLLFLAEKKYEEAEQSLNKAIEIRKESGFIKGLMISKLALAEVYIAVNKVSLAMKTIEAVIVSAKSQSDDTHLSKAYNLQRQVYESKKDYQNAYQAMSNYEQTLERVITKKTSIKLAIFLNNYESITKDLNIIALEKDAEIKLLQVSNERQKTKSIILFSCVVVLFLVAFIWSMQRSKKIIKKSNNKLSQTLIQLEQAQDKLVKSEQISALTILVSRIAHQVNTPLGIAVTGISHIHEKVSHFEDLVASGKVKKKEIDSLITGLNQSCELSSSSMNKVADLIHQFQMISANLQEESQQEFDVLKHLSKQTDLTLSSLKYNKPEINISGEEVLLVGYPDALNKVFSLLIINSIEHAFEETLNPKIDISIKRVEDVVEIIYQDNGKGIDSTIINHIFEPFYTTTIGNKNLGIGLSIVYNLVVQLMEGSIKCQVKQGKGSVFVMRLPRVTKQV